MLGGVPAAARRLDRVGLQLYTLRTEMARDLEGTLALVAAIGYREVEFAGYFERSPAAIRAALAENGLTSPASHTLLDPLVKEPQRLVDECAEIGQRYLVLAYLLPAQRGPLDGYRRVAEELARVSEIAAKSSVRIAYHNHDFEFGLVEGKVPLEVLIENTPPASVDFELDLYWAVRGGADPVDLFRRYPGRFSLWHVKDMEKEGTSFSEVGDGRIDFPRIFSAASVAGAKHFFIEQDTIRGDAFESVKRSFDYVRLLEPA